MFKVNSRHQNDAIVCLHVRKVILVPLLMPNFTACSIVSIVNSEQANARLGKIFMTQRFN